MDSETSPQETWRTSREHVQFPAWPLLLAIQALLRLAPLWSRSHPRSHAHCSPKAESFRGQADFALLVAECLGCKHPMCVSPDDSRHRQSSHPEVNLTVPPSPTRRISSSSGGVPCLHEWHLQPLCASRTTKLSGNDLNGSQLAAPHLPHPSAGSPITRLQPQAEPLLAS